MSVTKKDKTGLFMVWTKTGRPPKFAHGSLAAAEAEAVRLAELHPGKKFIVLQSVSKFGAAE